ncbi:MAG: TonB-dependent receptor [Longimicrobiales bacterium]
MRRTLPLLLLAAGLGAVAGPAAAAAQEPGTVSGTVLGRFESRARPLPFAMVEAWGPAFRSAVLADSTGAYLLRGVPGGALQVRASHPGHDPVTVDVIVPAGAPFVVDLELRVRPVALRSLDVTTDVRIPDPDRRELEAEMEARLSAAALEIGSGAVDAGLADAVRAFAGNDPADASDVLFMRGSTTDLKLVLLDGAPVYTPFHVAGLLKSFEPAVLGRADLYVGGAPARYDGGLTYILDLRTRRPRRDGPHLSASVDLISASMALDAPLGAQAGVVASARSLHSFAEAPLGASPYGYRDVLVGVEAEPARGHLVRATGFWNRESVVLDLPSAVGVAAAAAASAPDQAWWSNRAASASWSGKTGSLFLEAMVAASAYDATLPLQPSSAPGVAKPAALLASASTQRMRAGVEGARPVEGGMIRAGLSVESLDADYAADPLGAGSIASAAASASTAVGAYLDASRQLGPEVTLRAGLRADHFSGDGPPRFAPRASLVWRVGPQALVTVATGRYHQTARANDVTVEQSLTEVVQDRAVARTLLPVATADHVVVSLDQTLGQAVRLGLAGFWKGYRGLRADPDEEVLSSGVDLRIQRRGERSTAWLGYGLSWYWSGSDLSGTSSNFTGRQLLTSGLSGTLGSRFGAEVQVAYGAGLPYTSVPFRDADSAEAPLSLGAAKGQLDQSPPLTGGLDEDFLRVDLEVHAAFRTSWLGRDGSLRPYVRILNALDRRDALFYAFQPWRSDALTPLAQRPLVPVVGLSWAF